MPNFLPPRWKHFVWLALLGWAQPAAAFKTPGHEAIERRALTILEERCLKAERTGNTTLVPTREAIVRLAYGLPHWQKGSGADSLPGPRSQYPDPSWERQFAQDLQAYHFMAGNRPVVRAAKSAAPDNTRLHQLLLQTLPECLQLMRFLFWEACYNQTGASGSGRGLFVLLHIVGDSYSTEHTTRVGLTKDIKAVKGWRVSRPRWPEAAGKHTSEGHHQMLHGGFFTAHGDDEWETAKGSGQLTAQANEAAEAMADVLTLFYLTGQARRKQLAPHWDPSLQLYLHRPTDAVERDSMREVLTHTYYQTVAYGEPVWLHNTKNLPLGSDSYSQLDPLKFAASKPALQAAFRAARPTYDQLEVQLNQQWQQLLRERFHPFGSVQQSDTAFEYSSGSGRIVYRRAGDYVFHHPKPTLRQAAVAAGNPGPKQPTDAFDYDFHTSFTLLGTIQLAAGRDPVAWGGEVQWHAAPGAADVPSSMWRRLEYGVVVAAKSVPYDGSETQEAGRAAQANLLFALNALPLPYLNSMVQGRLGGGLTTQEQRGVVAGFDLAWNNGAPHARWPLRIVVGYEHNFGSLPMPNVFSLKLGVNSWKTRIPY